MTELLKRQPEQLEDGEEVQPKVKRQCSSHESSDDHDAAVQKENYKSPISVSKDEKMKKAQNVGYLHASLLSTNHFRIEMVSPAFSSNGFFMEHSLQFPWQQKLLLLQES